MKRSKKTTAEKIYDLIRTMPEEKQARNLDNLTHDCPHAHVPNERTIAAINEPKFTYSKFKNGDDILREILEGTDE